MRQRHQDKIFKASSFYIVGTVNWWKQAETMLKAGKSYMWEALNRDSTVYVKILKSY